MGLRKRVKKLEQTVDRLEAQARQAVKQLAKQAACDHGWEFVRVLPEGIPRDDGMCNYLVRFSMEFNEDGTWSMTDPIEPVPAVEYRCSLCRAKDFVLVSDLDEDARAEAVEKLGLATEKKVAKAKKKA